jgi:ATPase subunit of ABC transporter with duplicated ATPase domains
VNNVSWLVDYLNNLQGVTSMIVSHDSGFLDRVCTHITHYANRKLKVHRGNLSQFVKVGGWAEAPRLGCAGRRGSGTARLAAAAARGGVGDDRHFPC